VLIVLYVGGGSDVHGLVTILMVVMAIVGYIAIGHGSVFSCGVDYSGEMMIMVMIMMSFVVVLMTAMLMI
jgi:hypothetical protein